MKTTKHLSVAGQLHEHREARRVAAVATGSDAFGATADSEIGEHMNKFLDELKWFREHSVKIHLSPTATGWNLKFSVPEK